LGGSALYVVEADEYDRAFLSLAPTVAVVNNVEADHLECYGGSVAALEQAFAEFAGRARRVIAGADDAGAMRVAAALETAVWRGGAGGGAPDVSAAPRGGGVPTAPVLPHRAARRSARPGAGERRRRGGGADLRGARAAAPGCHRGSGGAGGGARRSGDGGR